MSVPEAAVALQARRSGRWLSRARRFPLNLQVGAFILFVYLVVAITGPWWAPYSPYEQGSQALLGSSWDHLFGTDILGRDVFSRVIHGTRGVLFLSLAGVALATIVGGVIGIVSGYVGGWIDAVVWRFLELLLSIPQLIFILLIIAAVGAANSKGTLLLVGIIVVSYAPRTARMARAIAVDLSVREFVTVARSRGESAWSITARELAPNATGVLLVEFGVRAGAAPLLISSLGFLGFGSRPPSPEWGLMIAENRSGLVSAPMTVFGPVVALSILVIGLNVFTDGLARVLGRSAIRT